MFLKATIQLDETVVSLGEIYFRLIRGIEFDHKEFRQVLQRVGRIAGKMLHSSTNYAQQSEIVKEAGVDAFEHGLFAGHKDCQVDEERNNKHFCHVCPSNNTRVIWGFPFYFCVRH